MSSEHNEENLRPRHGTDRCRRWTRPATPQRASCRAPSRTIWSSSERDAETVRREGAGTGAL